MPTAEVAESLMDDAEFYAELGKLEATPGDDTSEFPDPTATLGGAPQKPLPRPRRPVGQIRGDAPNFMMPPPTSDDPPIAAMPHLKPTQPRGIHPAVGVIGFVLMMLVGAGASALVFHDRVELLVAQWQSASR